MSGVHGRRLGNWLFCTSSWDTSHLFREAGDCLLRAWLVYAGFVASAPTIFTHSCRANRNRILPLAPEDASIPLTSSDLKTWLAAHQLACEAENQRRRSESPSHTMRLHAHPVRYPPSSHRWKRTMRCLELSRAQHRQQKGRLRRDYALAPTRHQRRPHPSSQQKKRCTRRDTIRQPQSL